MKLYFSSLFWFPLFLLSLFALVFGLESEFAYRGQREILVQERLTIIQERLSKVGRVWERRLVKPGGLAVAAGALSVEDAAMPGYVLVDGRGAEFRFDGRAWVPGPQSVVRSAEFMALLERARMAGVVAGLVDNHLLAIYPLPGIGDKASVLVAEEDFPVAFFDLDQKHFQGQVYLAAMFVFASLLLFFLVYFVISRRLARIDVALRRFGAGDAESRTGLRGTDLIARLGLQFDRMAERMATERQNLAESEERLKFALHGSNAGIWDWHLESGRTYYSPRWKSLLGFAEDELVAHAEEWLKRVHPEDLPQVMACLKDHMAGKTEFFESEHRLRCKDGSYLWVLERGMVARNEQGVACRMVGALTDISRRKEVESALLRSEEGYRSVVEGVTQVIFRSDVWGCLSFLNPAWSESTGHPVAGSLSTNLASFIVEEDRPHLLGLFRAAAEGDLQILECELRLLCHGQQTRWFFLHARALLDERGEIVVAGVLTDIDAQKVTEDALTRSNRERNAILSLSPDGFVFVDSAGLVAYVNPAFLGMTQFSPEEIVGQSVLLLEESMAKLCDPAKALPSLVCSQDDRESTMHLLSPSKRILRWLVRSIPNDQGGVHGHVMFFRDVTQESEVDRMKSEFLSTAAHELRTPMASIFGFSELLLAREFDPETQRDLIQTIHRQTQNLINLVNELLDLARIEARGGKTFKMLEQDLSPLLLNALAAQYVPAETHTLELDFPKTLPRVRVDGEKFQQCMSNVLSNAIKYSPLGGPIRVSTLMRQGKAGEQLGIAVKDSGIGMTPEEVGRVFERFFRADSSRGIPGTGLGMALVKEVMGIFGGEVQVLSEPGEGTEVTLWLPVASSGTSQSGTGVRA